MLDATAGFCFGCMLEALDPPRLTTNVREKPMSTTQPSESQGSAAADIFAFAPFGTAALYLIMAVYSRAFMGHWPRYYEYLTVFDSPIFKLLSAAFLLSGLVSVLSVALFWGRWITWQAALFVVGWVMLVALVMADPHGFTSFLID